MRSLGRYAFITVGSIMALSIVGLTQLAAVVGLIALPILVLLLALGSLRPATKRPTTGRARAHRVNFLGRYGKPQLSLGGLGEAFIMALAAEEILNAFAGGFSLEGAAVVALAYLFLFALVPKLASDIISIVASVVLVTEIIALPSEARDTKIVFGIAVLLTLLLIVVWEQPGFLPRMMYRNTPTKKFLAFFALLELAASIAHQDDVPDLWSDADTNMKFYALGLFAVITFFVAYAPDLVVGLIGIALVALRLYVLGFGQYFASAYGVPSDSVVTLAALVVAAGGAYLGSAYSAERRGGLL